MNNTILDFICKMEGWKTSVKNLHWNSNSLSQHKQCDQIADEISEFQDVVSEVEQGISGNLPYNKLKGKEYHITTISQFLKDVIKDTTDFYKKLESMGDNYIGLHSECESFLTKIQREVYLINFTLKEDFKRNYAQKVNESKASEDIINEAVKNVINRFMINEIGDTPRGQFALGAVRGRAVARPRYQNGQYNGVQSRAKQDSIVNQASDEAWNERSKQGGFNNPKREQMNQQYSSGYDYGYKKGMTESCDENCNCEAEIKGGMYNDAELDFTHFAVNKATNLVVDGWGYAGYDSEELQQFKKDYFYNDLIENGYNPKAYKILSFKGCQKQGIDPNNNQNWSNTGVYPLSQEKEMGGEAAFAKAHEEHPDWFVEN